MGFDRERLFARILVRQRQDVDRVLQALHAGEPFAELAQRFAANDLFAPQGDGVVGWIGRTQAQRFAIPPQTFLSLPVGQIAEPLPLAGGWQIYHFVEDRPGRQGRLRARSRQRGTPRKVAESPANRSGNPEPLLGSTVGPRRPASLADRAESRGLARRASTLSL